MSTMLNYRAPIKQRVFKAPRRQVARPSLARARSLPAAVSTTFSFKRRGKELDFVDTTLSSTAISTTPYLVLLNGLVPGTGDNQRLGRRIQMKSIELKAYTSADTTTTINIVRFAIVLDRQANGAAPAFTDIYDAASPTALRNISNKPRFKVLWDSGVIPIVGNITTPATGQELVTMEKYRKIDIPVQYNNGTAGDITDITTNSLYFVAVGAIASGTADSQLTGKVRVRYDDD